MAEDSKTVSDLSDLKTSPATRPTRVPPTSPGRPDAPLREQELDAQAALTPPAAAKTRSPACG